MGLTDGENPVPVATDKVRASILSEWGFRAWVASVLGVSLVFAMQGYYQSLIGPLSNLFPAAAAAAAFGSAILCFLRYGHGLRRGFELVWFFFSLGTGLWVVAEITWAVYYFAIRVAVPYPSIADFFYVGGYFPMLAGLAIYGRTFSKAMSRRRLAASLAVICVAAIMALSFVVPLELSTSPTFLKALTDLGYPILDLALFSLTVLALAIFITGSIANWWLLFGVGSVLYVIGDEFFLYQVAAGSYYNGSLDDLIFILGYLTFAFAFYVHRRVL
ncbi:MAG: hypothetical protein ACLQEQ_09855 [Nitrososphaerales archaeon]